eukprot:TRINITY_DN769_c0_g1_i3.p2 TRINITY_DN769_c0_g1~~TRINITY_DN769_c0_g1_i3.p2  ORF type:complete len:106 (-),score=19.78 TRINITY_DN769_c0_g1_i3:1588-1905(-)
MLALHIGTFLQLLKVWGISLIFFFHHCKQFSFVRSHKGCWKDLSHSPVDGGTIESANILVSSSAMIVFLSTCGSIDRSSTDIKSPSSISTHAPNENTPRSCPSLR